MNVLFCPQCSSELKTINVPNTNLEIKNCDNCEGHWLGQGELVAYAKTLPLSEHHDQALHKEKCLRAKAILKRRPNLRSQRDFALLAIKNFKSLIRACPKAKKGNKGGGLEAKKPA